MKYIKWILILSITLGLSFIPGHVDFYWQDFHLRITPFVLILALITGTILLSLLNQILNLPKLWRQFKERKRQKAAWRGLSAIASGEIDDAKTQGQYAQSTPLGQFVAAQAAYLSGDFAQARDAFHRLENFSETRFLGLRGQIVLALKENNWAQATNLLNQAKKIRPKSPWVLENLFNAQLRSGQLEQTESVLKKLQRHGLLNQSDLQNHRGLLYWLKAEQSLKNQDTGQYAYYGKKAQEWLPKNPHIAIQRAQYLEQQGAQRKAHKLIVNTWKIAPHPSLALHMQTMVKDHQPLSVYRKFADLSAPLEAQLILADWALKANLWGPARQHLEMFHQHLETHQSCQLMQMLITHEVPLNAQALETWHQKAQQNNHDFHWQCRQCDSITPVWHVICPKCQTLGQIVWQNSLRQEGFLALPQKIRSEVLDF